MIVTHGASYLAVVPARIGSKRIPSKNVRPVAGRPLFAWSVEHVRRCTTPMRVVVSTDDPELRRLALLAGAEAPVLRPPHLAGDEVATEPVLVHALATCPRADEISSIVLLPPTSPIRDDGSIDAAIALYESAGADSLVSVTAESPLQWGGTAMVPLPLYDVARRPRQQCVAESDRRYRENGSIVITSVAGLLATANRLNGRTVMYVMSAHEGIDVDDEYDLWLVEQWLGSRFAD